MSAASLARRAIGRIGGLPLVSDAIRQPRLREVLENIPGGKSLYGSPWDRKHPFDRVHGTDTSGVVPASELPAHEPSRAHALFYVGSQPSIIRHCLHRMAPLDSFTFLDLGCGKGRPLLVASEFPFRAITGIELSPPLADIGSRNANIIGQRFPERTPIAVEVGDASAFPIPAGDVVLFLYNPFGAEIVAKVVRGVEAALTDSQRTLYVVYYNPVAGHCFDASTTLRRVFAQQLTYGEDEMGFGPDASDTVVIWHGGKDRGMPVSSNANARIVLNNGATRATLAAG